jgi:hypothetical protein
MITRFVVVAEKNPRRISPTRAFYFQQLRLLFFAAAHAATLLAFTATALRRRRCRRRSDQCCQAKNQKKVFHKSPVLICSFEFGHAIFPRAETSL